MREVKLVQGRLVKVDHVDRGAPIAVREDEMRSRWWMRRRRYLLIVELLVWASITTQYMRGRVSVEYVLLFGLLFATSVIFGYFLFSARTPPGLYLNGVQHPQAYFLPYEEIGQVQVRDGAGGLGGPFVRLTPRFKGGTWDWDYYDIPIELLGEGGVETIMDRIANLGPPDPSDGQVPGMKVYA